MYIKPKKYGVTELRDEVLREDKQSCLVIGPCGLGKRALYLNNFYLDRIYYVAFEDIDRVFKRVAMSKGGYTGKGIFGSMPYLVVKLKDGREKQCNFKYEDLVDQFLSRMQIQHPQIPIHSEMAEKKLREAEAAEQARYLKVLQPEAQNSWDELEKAKAVLTREPVLSERLSRTAKQKRVIDNINPTYQVFALVILAAAVLAAVFGIYAWTKGMGGAVYFLLGGMAFMLAVISTRILPTRDNNKKMAAKEWNSAVDDMTAYLVNDPEFPVPPQYAHPVVLDRMIRVIREGRAQNQAEAFEVMKKDLKALNSSVKVSQKEYDEVVAIKPMFLVCDYE